MIRERPPPVARVGGAHGLHVVQPESDARPPKRLAMLQAPLPAVGAAFELASLLDWRVGLAPALVGRDAALSGLLAWANGGRRVRLRIVSGPGGSGKSRLAAALAAALPEWQAGVVPLAAGAALPFAGAGLLVVIERPEAAPEAFRTLLREAALAEALAVPVRVLVLSRRPAAAWRSDIAACGATELCAAPNLALGPLPPEAAAELFSAITARLAERGGLAVSAVDFAAWHARRPALHGLPLLVHAAALAAAYGDALEQDGPDLLRGLARRQRDSLDGAAAAHGWTGRGASRLVALAQLRETLDPPAIRRLAAPALAALLPRPEAAVAAVAALGWFAPASPGLPNLFAACLLRDVLEEAGDRARDWLWATLGDRWVLRPELLARRAEDWAALHGAAQPGLPALLAACLAGRPERADRWRLLLDDASGEPRLALVAAAVGQGLLAQPNLPDAQSAPLLNGVAAALWEAGDRQGAVAALHELVTLRRRLAQADPGRFDAPLALALATLSNRLSESGEAHAAVAPMAEAVALRRALVARDAARFEPELAQCLGQLSSRLAAAQQGAPAVAAIEEAAAIRRRLAQANPARHEPELAQSLHDLALRLVEAGNPAAAVAPAQEAVSIRRRLARSAPAQFEPDLARSLQNLSHRLAASGGPADALTAIGECVAIRRRLVQAAPERFAPELAESLATLSQRLADAGDGAAAPAPMREAVALRRRAAEADPARGMPMLAQALHQLAQRLAASAMAAPARAAVAEAIAIRTGLAEADPARHGAGLAASQGLLAELDAAEDAT